MLYTPSATRDRITGRLFRGCDRDGVELLNHAYDLVTGTEPLRAKLRETGLSVDDALAAGILSDADRATLAEVEAAVDEVITVDAFAPEELVRCFPAADDRPPTAKAVAE